MKKFFLLVFIFLVKISSAQYVAGGEIKYTCLGGNQYRLNISLWGESLNSTDTLFIDFGNSVSATLTSPSITSLASSLPANYSNYVQASWQTVYIYSGAGSYKISAVYNTRRAGISNIPNSSGSVFYLACDIEVDPAIGCNSSPVFSNASYILFDSAGNSFVSPVSVSDPDGDSLSFVLQPCDVPGYTFPDMIGGGTLSINGNTGTTSWNTPQQAGIYNYVLRTVQWKHLGNGVVVAGYTDMEIEIDVTSTSGIFENHLSLFSIYPQPANDFISIENFPSPFFYEITDVAGKILKQETYSGKISTADFADGIYLLRLQNEEGAYLSRKFIVQH